MDQEFIKQKIKDLQSDNSLCFKLTNEIIEIVYKIASNDTEAYLSNTKNINNQLKYTEKKLNDALSEIEKLKDKLRKSEHLKTKKFGEKPINQEIEKKKSILEAKLESYNKVFDWIYLDQKDLLTIYSELKTIISQLNNQLKNNNF